MTKPIAWYVCAIYTYRPWHIDGREVPDIIDAFYKALDGFRAADIELAFIHWLCDSQDFPEPEDIIDLIRQHGQGKMN